MISLITPLFGLVRLFRRSGQGVGVVLLGILGALMIIRCSVHIGRGVLLYSRSLSVW